MEKYLNVGIGGGNWRCAAKNTPLNFTNILQPKQESVADFCPPPLHIVLVIFGVNYTLNYFQIIILIFWIEKLEARNSCVCNT